MLISLFFPKIIKKVLISIFILVICLLTCFLILRWLDNMTVIVPEESIIDSPEIKPFLAGRTGFQGISWDLDTNEVVFSFPTNFNDAKSYFDTIHLAATSNGWKLWYSSSFKRIYKSTEKRYTTLKIDTILEVTLLYNPNNSTVIFNLR